jgi:hypothetical protein
MNQNADIIGIVKELQDIPEVTFVYNGRKYLFQAIAQALLIAVEALEVYSNEMPGGICDAADEALSRIRSIPSA